ncbi:MAG: hypothetical protein AAF799_25300 [Myxococcota bacterium]
MSVRRTFSRVALALTGLLCFSGPTVPSSHARITSATPSDDGLRIVLESGPHCTIVIESDIGGTARDVQKVADSVTLLANGGQATMGGPVFPESFVFNRMLEEACANVFCGFEIRVHRNDPATFLGRGVRPSGGLGLILARELDGAVHIDMGDVEVILADPERYILSANEDARKEVERLFLLDLLAHQVRHVGAGMFKRPADNVPVPGEGAFEGYADPPLSLVPSPFPNTTAPRGPAVEAANDVIDELNEERGVTHARANHLYLKADPEFPDDASRARLSYDIDVTIPNADGSSLSTTVRVDVDRALRDLHGVRNPTANAIRLGRDVAAGIPEVGDGLFEDPFGVDEGTKGDTGASDEGTTGDTDSSTESSGGTTDEGSSSDESSSSEGGSSGGGGGASAADCALFCTDFMALCDPVENGYGTRADCEAMCVGFTEEEMFCRHLQVIEGASLDETVPYCFNAGPTGGLECAAP